VIAGGRTCCPARSRGLLCAEGTSEDARYGPTGDHVPMVPSLNETRLNRCTWEAFHLNAV
jgi:hypothetical protein